MIGDEEYLNHCRDMFILVTPASATLLLVLQQSPTHTNVRRGGVYCSDLTGMNGPLLSSSWVAAARRSPASPPCPFARNGGHNERV